MCLWLIRGANIPFVHRHFREPEVNIPGNRYHCRRMVAGFVPVLGAKTCHHLVETMALGLERSCQFISETLPVGDRQLCVGGRSGRQVLLADRSRSLRRGRVTADTATDVAGKPVDDLATAGYNVAILPGLESAMALQILVSQRLEIPSHPLRLGADQGNSVFNCTHINLLSTVATRARFSLRSLGVKL